MAYRVPYGKTHLEFNLLPGMTGIVSSKCPDVVADCKMTPAVTMEEALAASELGSDWDVLIVPHALLTSPVVGR